MYEQKLNKVILSPRKLKNNMFEMNILISTIDYKVPNSFENHLNKFEINRTILTCLN